MRRIFACIALAATLVVVEAAPAAPPGTAQASASRTVTVKNFEFTPATLRIGKGTRVLFANTSGTAHTATDKGAFDTGRIKGGKSASVLFKQKGTFAYHCKIHPFMRGKIVVG